MDTRSLSFCSLPLPSGKLGGNDTNSIINLALLIYESPTRNVSALLYRGRLSTVNGSSSEWVDITSQESKALPSAFRNPESTLYSNFSSFTLYETFDGIEPHVSLSTPFTCAANFSNYDVGLLFYWPDAEFPVVAPSYSINPGGVGGFRDGMYRDGMY